MLLVGMAKWIQNGEVQATLAMCAIVCIRTYLLI